MTTASRLLDRRSFLADLGHGALAIAILGVAACAPAASSTSRGPRSTSPGEPPTPGTTAGPASPPPSAPDRLSWTRVNLGFVSAYLLVRNGEAAVVDTGVAGSAGQIEATLASIGLGWANVAHVIATHQHADHVGSLTDVLNAAGDATGYAGAEDMTAIDAPRELTALRDGDRVFDLQVVATPGHTAGHIAVLDPATGVLVAGDALSTQGGSLAGSPPQFTADVAQARASVAKLAALQFETLLVGHGEPIEAGASTRVAELAAAG